MFGGAATHLRSRGGGGEIGEVLVTHPGIDAIGFTGSSATGKRILSQMGIKRSIMEMSGNGPTIVTEDAKPVGFPASPVEVLFVRPSGLFGRADVSRLSEF